MNPKRLNWTYAVLVVVAVFAASLVLNFNFRMAELRRLSAEHDQVATQLAEKTQESIRLVTQIAQATSEGAVVQWAYERGHMIRPGDQPVVPLSPVGATPVPGEAPAPKTPTLRNWQVWLLLFVDHIPTQD